ncbi:DUF6090 family protein [Chondrinema litorale]|uniref:DUF6090 family protein n=1 Tax=Chondrinema litorale TaxID=2994555 RepID=UPI002542E50C|nr:DUF6090 family protein [Chondrinema litorale]UZR95270.1 DUF6090 family protein [Chondrinema litorale]
MKKINWKYAVGEIIIVTIGITIAFAINQWAENSKNNKVKKQYLQSLIVDLDSEIEGLHDNIDYFDRKMNTIHVISPFLDGKKVGRDTIMRKVFNMALIVNFRPHDATYKALINSGDLKLFDDFDFKLMLEKHYAQHELIKQDYYRQHNIMEKYFSDFLIYEVDTRQIRNGNYDFMDKLMLKNIIQSLYGTYLIAMKTAEKGIEDCEETKKVLQTELEAFN